MSSQSISLAALRDDPARYTEIPGNAPDEVKRTVAQFVHLIVGHGKVFANEIGFRVSLMSMDIQEKAEEPAKREARVVLETDVCEGEHNNAVKYKMKLTDRSASPL